MNFDLEEYLDKLDKALTKIGDQLKSGHGSFEDYKKRAGYYAGIKEAKGLAIEIAKKAEQDDED